MKSTSFKYFISVIEYLVKEGTEKSIITQAFINSANVDIHTLDPNSRVDYALYEFALNLGSKLIHTSLFGFYLGQDIKSGDFGALGYLVETSNDLQQAIQTLMQFENLVADIGGSNLKTSNNHALITWQPYNDDNRHVILRNMTAWVAMVRLLIQNDLKPQSINFSFHLNIDEKNELKKWFGCPIYSNKSSNNILFPSEFLHLKITSQNKLIFNELTRVSEQQLNELSTQNSIKVKIERIFSNQETLEIISLQEISLSLHMSERNLQRKLKHEGTSYSNLLDAERKRRFKRLILHKPLGQIATQLGFAEQASLNKACKRWFDCSPKTLIRNQLSENNACSS